MLQRPRRNRKSEAIRNMIAETQIHKSDLIKPFFIVDGNKVKSPIKSHASTALDGLLICCYTN